jgi:hypothetical protein
MAASAGGAGASAGSVGAAAGAVVAAAGTVALGAGAVGLATARLVGEETGLASVLLSLPHPRIVTTETAMTDSKMYVDVILRRIVTPSNCLRVVGCLRFGAIAEGVPRDAVFHLRGQAEATGIGGQRTRHGLAGLSVADRSVPLALELPVRTDQWDAQVDADVHIGSVYASLPLDDMHAAAEELHDLAPFARDLRDGA